MGSVQMKCIDILVLLLASRQNFRLSIPTTTAQKNDVSGSQKSQNFSKLGLNILFDIEPCFRIVQIIVRLLTVSFH